MHINVTMPTLQSAHQYMIKYLLICVEEYLRSAWEQEKAGHTCARESWAEVQFAASTLIYWCMATKYMANKIKRIVHRTQWFLLRHLCCFMAFTLVYWALSVRVDGKLKGSEAHALPTPSSTLCSSWYLGTWYTLMIAIQNFLGLYRSNASSDT